ncbi:U32 family peptidase [Anaerovibrio sp.]|uniref:DUF3656 domain-containing U32 family peptidase n=1 Tax=Anaerovibrio sp. TaxID=1872532 RepID=UPI002634570B|nr:U32 family peptidase [Anaerovibrio sp.]MDD6597797.1 DUF3656 domain-containing protein [Anaerovibrio sp.]
MIELLAPAGSREALVAAVESGADAVYLAGNMFGARAYADNFDEEGMREAIRFAHLRGVHVHVTVNTIMDSRELPELKKYLRFLYEAGADAVLVQDLGAARIVRETVPELPMHASTQMTVHNLDGVRALEALGFSRVVLSREVTLEAVRHICTQAKAEIEVFIHGALCVCYSGQCLMSSMIGGRSGNRGRCAQPCRLPYTLVDEKDNDMLGDSAGKYLLSPRDMNTINLLPELLAAGVTSLKIEGRMKRPEYVAVAVGCYRRAVDSFLSGDFAVPEEDSRALAQIFNRDFTTAYLEKKQGRNMMSDKRPNNRGLMLGRVQEYHPLTEDSGLAVLRLSDGISAGDQVDFWVKVGGRVTATVQDMQLVTGLRGKHNLKNAGKNINRADKKNQERNQGKKQDSNQAKKLAKNASSLNMQNLLPVEKAAAGDMVALTVKGRVFPGDRVFKVYDGKLMESAKAMYSTGAPVRRFGVRAVVRAAVGQPLYLSFTDEYGNVAEAETEFMGQEAMKRPLTKETLMKQIGRLGTSIFTLRELKAEISGHVMVPVSELNEVRRKCVGQLEKMRLADFQAAADKARVEAAAAVRAGLANFYSVIEKTASENIRSRNRGETGITVVADDLAKLSAALEGGADRIVFGGENYRHEAITLPMYEMAVKLAKTAGGKVVFNTPRIIRDGELDAFHRWLENIRDMGADGISIHNIGSLYAARMMTDLPVEADFSLISYNIETLRHFQELGISRAVLSPELNMTQLAELAGQSPVPVECLAEGNLELMVSEYCCTGSFLGGLDKGSCGAPCVNSGKSFFLKDRKDIKFPLVMDQYCHMHLLNGSRLSMLPHAMKFRQLGISSLRIDGRYMDEGQLRKTVRNYRKYMAYPAELTEAEKKAVQQLEGENITRGHYFRGVL